jgi:hypothetical protein
MEKTVRRDQKRVQSIEGMSSLNKNASIHVLAADLKLKPSPTPVTAILHFCERIVRKTIKGFSQCEKPAELLQILANSLSTLIIEIRSDKELDDLMAKYSGEPMVQMLADELKPKVFGITIRRQNKKPWEPTFLSIIDCRGQEKAARANHTKWHELGHLFILTDQTRISFQRSFCQGDKKDPEEQIVDTIAGHFEYWPPFFAKHCRGTISFSKIENIRQEFCSEASKASALIGLVKAWDSPCLFLEAELRYKKGESAARGDIPLLRVVRSTANDEALQRGIYAPPNWRVPSRSAIAAVHEGEIQVEPVVEDLGAWETTDGSNLSSLPVYVECRSYGRTVQALIYPA